MAEARQVRGIGLELRRDRPSVGPAARAGDPPAGRPGVELRHLDRAAVRRRLEIDRPEGAAAQPRRGERHRHPRGQVVEGGPPHAAARGPVQLALRRRLEEPPRVEPLGHDVDPGRERGGREPHGDGGVGARRAIEPLRVRRDHREGGGRDRAVRLRVPRGLEVRVGERAREQRDGARPHKPEPEHGDPPAAALEVALAGEPNPVVPHLGVQDRHPEALAGE